MTTQRFYVVLDANGGFIGAHAEDDRGIAVPLTQEALSAAMPAVGALMARIAATEGLLNEAVAALETVRAEREQVIAERDALQAQIDAAAAKAKLVVSPLQARKALKAANLLATVQAMIAAAPEDDDIRLAWDWALSWERDSPFVAQLGAGLGLSDKQIDDLFAAAAAL